MLVDLHDLDFVGLPSALSPGKSGVGCLDFVGLIFSCVCGAVLMFPRNVPTKSEAPSIYDL